MRQANGIQPKLAIVQSKDDPVINTYVGLKKRYGSDIGIEVEVHFVPQSEMPALIASLNDDAAVHGIIVQLPLEDISQTDRIVNLVAGSKDVDALGTKSQFDPATPMAIMWLLAGYGIELAGKRILLIGRGKLVGAPLERILLASGYNVEVVDRQTDNLTDYTKNADLIITATGSPAILYPDMIKQNAVVVDAGVASEDGRTVGDLHGSVYAREDLTLTPPKGGVGPLTVSALFENVLVAARRATRIQ